MDRKKILEVVCKIIPARWSHVYKSVERYLLGQSKTAQAGKRKSVSESIISDKEHYMGSDPGLLSQNSFLIPSKSTILKKITYVCKYILLGNVTK